MNSYAYHESSICIRRSSAIELAHRIVKTVISMGLSHLTPHTADGRCRHAACGATGAPARRAADAAAADAGVMSAFSRG